MPSMSFSERVSYLVGSLRVQDPSLDTSPISPIRTLINAVAEMGAQADIAVDRVYDWDISSKSGRDLDNFCSLFGFSRLPAKHSLGFVNLIFSSNTTRDYLIPAGTRLVSDRRGPNGNYTYLTAETVGIPRFTAYQTIPIVSEFPGASYNARSGEIRSLDFNIEQLIQVVNEQPVNGGRRAETDEELRLRFRSELFRSNLGNASWYRNIALRHPKVSAIQLITPSQNAEEHLKIFRGSVECQEDSLVFTYPNSISVYLVKEGKFLEENKDYITIVDNDKQIPPVIEFTSGIYNEGDIVTVRYKYCSSRSRNNPSTSNMHYLDMYVKGSQPMPVIDYSNWPNNQVFGEGTVSLDSHPGGTYGLPYYVFVRQPVLDIQPEVQIQGVSYFRGRDYDLIKDTSINANSSRAKDILLWKTNLPVGNPNPAFHFPYFHDSVISEIQEVIDQPDMHTAVDDILVHSSVNIEFDIDLVIEWERGLENIDSFRISIENYFASVPMGSKIRIGSLMKAMSESLNVAAVFLGDGGISSKKRIRGKNNWKYDVPLPDGSVPILGNLNITTTASNIYN